MRKGNDEIDDNFPAGKRRHSISLVPITRVSTKNKIFIYILRRSVTLRKFTEGTFATFDFN